MGFLNLSRPRAVVQRLPSGSLTVDRTGRIVATTVSSSYPEPLLDEIGREVLRLFHEARAAQMPLLEVQVHFASLQITAREARGGAIIFLSPKISAPEASSVEVRPQTRHGATHQKPASRNPKK